MNRDVYSSAIFAAWAALLVLGILLCVWLFLHDRPGFGTVVLAMTGFWASVLREIKQDADTESGEGGTH